MRAGITCLVGPNGSGKSNVVDAMRWVFGEQNPRLLRGARWEDVIFAGSATRRPLGLAEVSITLDNSAGALPVAYREVEITRRLLRSGETEYSINRVPCRLKDIVDLLAGTGAAGAAYAYMPQAAVDEILKSRPEDRRIVVEEAAGLARYRSRRQEAERRLAEADAARQRVRDLIGELEIQLKPLQREAAAAERFIELRTRRDDVAARLWADTVFHLDRRAADAVSRREDAQQRMAVLAQTIGEAAQSASEVETALATARAARESADRAARDALSAETRLRSGLAVLAERRDNSARLQAGLARESGEAQQRLQEAEAALTAAQAQGAGNRGEGEGDHHAVAELAAVEQLLSSLRLAEAAAESDLRATRERVAQARTASARLEERVAAAQQQQELLAAGLAARRKELAGTQAEFERITARQLEARTALDAANRQLNEVRAAGAAAEARLRQLRDAQADRQAAQGQLEGELTVVRETLAQLDASAARLPLAAATKHVADLARREALSRRVAPLVELLVVEPGWERAVATGLGLAQHAVVLDSWPVLTAVLDYAQARAAAGGVVLMAAETPGVAAPVRAPAAGQSLRNFVRSSEPDILPESVLDQLLSGFVCAGDLTEAVSLQQAGWQRGVIMSDGSALLPGGVYVAAGVDGQIDQLSLHRERQRLATKAATAGAAADAGRTALRELADEIKAAGEDLKLRLGQRGHAERLRGDALQRLQQLERSEAQASARYQSLSAEVDRLSAQLAAAVSAQEYAAAALAAAVGCYSVEADALAGCEELATRSAGEAAAAATAAERLRVSLARIREAERAAIEQAAALRAAADRLRQQVADLSVRLQAVDRGAASLAVDMKDLERQLACAVTAREAAEAKAEDLAVEVKGKELALRNGRQQLEQLAASRADLERRLARIEVNIERMAGEAKALAVERRAMPGRFADLCPVPASDVGECRAELAQLEADLAAVGTVDLGAAEQCRRLTERHGFLSAQEEDLAASAAALVASALELEREIESRFVRSFDETRARFATVFSELFGGGRADLELTDAENPLSSGVEVLAQPPGKRMTSLALLSGGERALTAIALLFALMGNSESGFCVLDEVDAHLDEPNCLRFRRYLRNLAKERQFLVVSHSKVTMEAADVLYGLTMEEDGVSRVISVRLAEQGRNGRVI